MANVRKPVTFFIFIQKISKGSFIWHGADLIYLLVFLRIAFGLLVEENDWFTFLRIAFELLFLR